MHLVVQGASIDDSDAEQLLRLSGAREVLRLGPGVCRLLDARRAPGIAEHCARARLDFGFVPEDRKLTDMKLLAIDMDSTLIDIECIDEIADMAGVKKRRAQTIMPKWKGTSSPRRTAAERLWARWARSRPRLTARSTCSEVSFSWACSWGAKRTSI